MSERFTADRLPITPAQVWVGLTAECQTCVIDLLARLASNLVAHQLVPSPPENSSWRPDRTPSRSGPTTTTDSP
jgi:hypothetical protein